MKLPEWTHHEQEGIIQVKITMSFPLRWVNSYILRGDDGVTIIDPGPRSPVTEAEWDKVWSELAIHPKHDIKQIVLTHHHPDHYGLSGWMQEQSEASVWMSKRAHAEAQYMWGEAADINDQLPDFFRAHGMTEEWAQQLRPHLESFDSEVLPAPMVSYIEGERFDMAGRHFSVIETGGHAPGHLSFYEESTGIILCGDAVLPQISPNVSLLPGSDEQPLRHFIEGLHQLSGLKVSRAFAGHRHPFTGFESRIQGLLKHHEERLDEMEGMLQEGEKTAFEVCVKLFGTKFGIHQMRFAMAETLAHLDELVRLGRAVMKLPDSREKIVKFAPA
ncbi:MULTISPECIES: MBL fold metallo-hydrolase [unclassified Paenibacillus]|uniref:MBL fold metallo-hydrolase n=1 Tax=unclassified Paenibacillus TaxID=185978 RepID=UPI00089B8038|nr:MULTISPECIES: MBL fold metallo-hydrolase [unclassified Paenibacillus]OMC64905.1 MBL fold metallo-hydrolase [Paenibacillus sp. FSL H7-0326]SDX52026.1 Glyoxylase, beta-lactamase superfamily II [Paenibacillus sp. PDC88]